MEDEECIPENSGLKFYLQSLGLSDFQVTKNSQRCPSSIRFEVPKPKSKSPFVEAIDEDVIDQISIIVSTQMLFEEDISKVEELLSSFKVVKNGMLKNMFKDFFGVAVIFMGLCLYWILGHYALFIVSSFYAYTAADYLRRKHFNKIRLKKLTTILQANFMLLRKTVKFIEENRLIEAKNAHLNNSIEFMRGFDFYQNFKSDFEVSVKEVINVFVKSTQELMNKVPFYDCIDNPDYYLCNNLNEYYTSFNLSTLYETYLLVQSEFLKRLVLSLIPNIKLSSKNDFHEYNKILTETCVSLLKIKNKLNKKFKFLFLNGIHTPKNKVEFKLPLKNETGNRYCNEFIFNIHETSNTFQNLLLKCRSLEESLTSQNLPQYVEEELTKIQNDLDTCQRNISDSFILLQKANFIEDGTCKSDEVKVEEEELKNSTENLNKVVVGHSDLDPKVEDEIFEAYFADERSDRPDFDDWNPDDRLIKKLQKEYSKNVMKELKVKLVEKAKYWRKRERELLKKKGLLDETEDLSEDEEKIQHSDEEVEVGDDSEKVNNFVDGQMPFALPNSESKGTSDYRESKISVNKDVQEENDSEKYLLQRMPSPVEPKTDHECPQNICFETPDTGQETSDLLSENSEIDNTSEDSNQFFNKSLLDDLNQARQKIFKSSPVEEEFFCVSGEDSSSEGEPT